jgi:large repetitive protein
MRSTLALPLLLSALCGCWGDKKEEARDVDGDGYTVAEGDCDDADSDTHPGSDDLKDDRIDNNCDGVDGFDGDGDGLASQESGGDDCNDEDPAIAGKSTYYIDNDGDGYGNPDVFYYSCTQPEDYVEDSSDCNDLTTEASPENQEVCDNGLDNDCDGLIDDADPDMPPPPTWYPDVDGDGFGDDERPVAICKQPYGHIEQSGDCNDLEKEINPDATEVCDEVDNNCDLAMDDEDSGLDSTTAEVFYIDADMDGFGSDEEGALTTNRCRRPTGYSENTDDCDDADPTTFLGAPEVCDSADNDCDGNIDEGLLRTFYMDADGDGYGDPQTSIEACENGCDSIVTEIWLVEFPPSEGCEWNEDEDPLNTNSPASNGLVSARIESSQTFQAGSTESICGASFPFDASAGGMNHSWSYDDAALLSLNGYVLFASHSALADSLDADNIGKLYDWSTLAGQPLEDGESQSWGLGTSLVYLPDPEYTYSSDSIYLSLDSAALSDITATALNSGRLDLELVAFGDNDEPGSADGADCYSDTLGFEVEVYVGSRPSDYVENAEDCDDGNPSISPISLEVCDAPSPLDNDCDGLVDEADGSWDTTTGSIFYSDADGDGYGNEDAAMIYCSAPDGYVSDSMDCDDTSEQTFPGAAENESPTSCRADEDEDGYSTVEYDCDDEDYLTNSYGSDPTIDGIDQNCDGVDGEDSDGDGYVSVSGGGDDCDDSSQSIHPEADEICNLLDDDCDGLIDDDDDSLDLDSATDYYIDLDGDGGGDPASLRESCVHPEGYVTNPNDCVDTDPEVTDVDIDEDGFGLCGGDCDDDNPNTHPGAAELESLDDCMKDDDGDGYGERAPFGSIAPGTDCNDSRDEYFPGAPENCTIEEDQDCDDLPPEGCGSCLEIHLGDEETEDGIYTITSQVLGEYEVYCDMTTDGGGWTLVQRTVWDWAESASLLTDYSTWYQTTIGSPDPELGFRLAGLLWAELNIGLDHMFAHTGRDSSSGEDCGTQYYKGTSGTFSINLNEASLAGLSSSVDLIDASGLSTTDMGESIGCVNTQFAVPWFYENCCTTCPTFMGSFWTDDPHPTVKYLDTDSDLFGNTTAQTCPSGAALSAGESNNLAWEGVNTMEFYLR